jgi:ketosteroid isomerase-like protein
MQRMARFPMLVVQPLLLAFLGFGCQRVPAQQTTPERELLQFTRDWCTALLNKDAAFLDRMLADDYTGVGPNGTAETKRDALVSLEDPTSALTVCVDHDIKARVYDDAAVVTGMGTHTGTYKGAAFAGPAAIWTDTWVKRDGRWQCVASHATFVAPPNK